MALHRDIFWIGRQWAVTGFGVQAVNQKHEGQFDIPIERLWDDDLPNGAREQKWFNPDDFNKGLEIARARHPKPRQSAKPPSPAPAEATRTSTATAVSEPQPLPIVSAVVEPAIVVPETAPQAAEPSTPPPSFPDMRVLGHPARLSRVWHARRRK
jgi:hypothetical protein